MNYTTLIKEALQLSWFNKKLWILAFFVTGGSFFLQSNNQEISEWGEIIGGLNAFFYNVAHSVGLVFIMLFLLVLFFLFLLVSFIFQSGLLLGIKNYQDDKVIKLGDLIRKGSGPVWRLLGIYLILAVPNILFSLPFLYALMSNNSAVNIFSGISFGLLFVYNVFIYLFKHFVLCQAVYQEQSVWQSIKSGYMMFRKNLSKVMIVRLIELGMMVASLLLFIVSLFVVLIPFLLMIVVSLFSLGEVAFNSFVLLTVLVALVYLILYRGFIVTFFQSYLTGVYFKLKK